MLRFTATNAQHIGSRSYQEDYFAILDPVTDEDRARYGLLGAIADGMGGMAHGDAAARLAVRSFLDSYRERTSEETASAALLRAVNAANAAVWTEATKRLLKREMGTTLVASVIDGEQLHWISIGDSGLFLLRDGRLRRLNRPHIYANVLDAKLARGEMTREAAFLHPHREALTSYVGGEQIDEFDQSSESVPLQKGDVVLLASDGLFKTLSTAEITKTLTEAANPAESLVQRTLVAGGLRQDNVTVISICAGDRTVSATQQALSEEETAEIAGDSVAPAATRAIRPKRPALLLLGVIAAAAAVLYFLR